MPEEFPLNLTPESFAKERRKSQPRNKTILNVFYKSKEVEMFGSGFKKVYKLCADSGVDFSYDSTSDGFSFVFYRRNKNVTVNVTQNVTANLTNTDLKVLNLLKKNQYYRKEEIASKLGLTVRTIQRSLNKLVEAGKIIRRNSDKNGHWEII